MSQGEINKIKIDRPGHLTGSCLCGGVRYRIKGLVRDVVNCYCTQCQKTSGHHVAATRIKEIDLIVQSDSTLKWYPSSPGINRGFCSECGGNLFWNNGSHNEISVMAGTIDAPTGLKTVAHVHEEDASDYFEIPNI